MKNFSYLNTWLKGNERIPHFDKLTESTPDYNATFWLNIVDEVPFYKIKEEKIIGFEESYDTNRKYYFDAIKIAHHCDDNSLDNEDRYNIIEELGEPPNVSYPIYIIYIEKDNYRKIVYIGKSSSNISRFRGGHSTAIKLLNPKYDGYSKNIMLCNIMLYTTNDFYLPLEFVKNKNLGLEILDDVESRLIDAFKPELNRQKMKGLNAKHHFYIMIENHISHFLHGRDF